MLVVEHADIYKRAQILEKASLEFLRSKKQLSREEYLSILKPYGNQFKTGLEAHFRIEETAIFPIFMAKSQTARRTIPKLISEHSWIMQRFKEFGDIEEYDISIQTLTDLMIGLSSHAKKEDEILSSIPLTQDEASRVNELARGIGFQFSWDITHS